VVEITPAERKALESQLRRAITSDNIDVIRDAAREAEAALARMPDSAVDRRKILARLLASARTRLDELAVVQPRRDDLDEWQSLARSAGKGSSR